MSMLEPDEEILPKETAKDEPGLQDDEEWHLPDPAVMASIAALIVAALLLFKLYIWYGWMLPSSPATRLRRTYRASLARLYDLGYRRMEGETRAEFMNRISTELRGPVMSATNDLLSLAYQDSQSYSGKISPLTFLITDRETMKNIPMWKRALAAVSITSLLYSRKRSQW
jgi:hypothetical protein